MNSRQGILYHTTNAAINITNVSATLKTIYMAVSDNSNTFVQLMDTNMLLTRQLRESQGKNTMLLEMIKTLGGSAPPTHH